MVTDEDASSEARIKSQVNLDNLDKKDRLTDQVRENIVKSFRIALMENKGDAEGMQLAITSIVPHALGQHDSCGKWCKFHEDPAAYRSKHLPGGKVFKEMV